VDVVTAEKLPDLSTVCGLLPYVAFMHLKGTIP
jgi:hypothetical protein